MKLHCEINLFQVILINPKWFSWDCSSVFDLQWLTFGSEDTLLQFPHQKIQDRESSSCLFQVLRSGSWIWSSTLHWATPCAIKNLSFVIHFRKLKDQHKALISFSSNLSHKGVWVVNTKAAWWSKDWGRGNGVHHLFRCSLFSLNWHGAIPAVFTLVMQRLFKNSLLLLQVHSFAFFLIFP